jgi:hypothetical protein
MLPEFYSSDDLNETYCYWIDSVRHELPDSDNYIYTFGIKVINNKIYVGAYCRIDYNNYFSQVCYWIDNVQYIVPDTIQHEGKINLVFSDGKVFVIGDNEYLGGCTL